MTARTVWTHLDGGGGEQQCSPSLLVRGSMTLDGMRTLSSFRWPIAENRRSSFWERPISALTGRRSLSAMGLVPA
jgi:hypothetical protein